MAAHMSHRRRGSGDTGSADAVRRPNPAWSGRSSRARRYEPLSGQLILPGLDHLPEPAPGGAPRTEPGSARGGCPDAGASVEAECSRTSSGPGRTGLGEPGRAAHGGTPVPKQRPRVADAPDTREGDEGPDGPTGAPVRARRASDDDGPSPAPAVPVAPGPQNGPGARNGAPSRISARFVRLCARGREPRRTERRCEGAGFRPPGRRRLRRGARCDGGMSTAEYALGTVSAVAFAGVLYVILTGGTVTEVLTDIVVDALSSGM